MKKRLLLVKLKLRNKKEKEKKNGDLIHLLPNVKNFEQEKKKKPSLHIHVIMGGTAPYATSQLNFKLYIFFF